MHLAVGKGNEEITELLLTKGANVHAKGRHGTTSLCNATEGGYLQIVINFAYTSTTQHGYTPRRFAVEKGDEQITELLLSKRANVNTKGRHGITSLHLGTQWGHLRIVEHLLKHGANGDDSSSLRGHTPLYLAVECGYKKIVKLVLECSATINSEDMNDKTTLHLAVKKIC